MMHRFMWATGTLVLAAGLLAAGCNGDGGGGESPPEDVYVPVDLGTPDVTETQDEGGGEDPGTQPDDPGTQPDDPGTQPDDPGTQPDDPGTQPDDPGTPPDDPGTPPDDPGTPPDDPGTPPEDSGPGVDCVLHQDCLDDDFCTKDLCVEGKCTSEEVSCDDADDCTADTCNSLVGCIHAYSGGQGCTAYTELFAATFDDGTTQGMMVENLSPTEADEVVWTPDPSQTFAGAGALYFGKPGEYSYDNGQVVASTARTPTLTLPQGKAAELHFWLWADTEDGSDWDVLTANVIEGDASIPVWAKTDENVSMHSWQQVVVDLTAFAGQDVALELSFNSVDNSYNETVGVFVDGFAVLGLPSAKGCTKVEDCEDGIGCTEETCDAGVCSYVVGDSCCVTASDCFDGDFCTIDICGSSSTCENIPVAEPACCNTDDDCIDNNPCTHDLCQANHLCDNSVKNEPGCCKTKSDCNDDDKCTIDSCQDFICSNYNTCCGSDDECDDGDDTCTTDSCVEGKCKYAYLPIPGCCSPVLFEDTFETDAGDWSLTGGTCKWQVLTTAGQSKSPPGALYYGNAAAKNFNCGVNAGTATSGEIDLPDKDTISLEFDVYYDTESGSSYDKIFVYAKTGGSNTYLSDKSKWGGTKTWHKVKVSLSSVKGETIQIFIDFNTVDSIGNSGEGVYFDNVKVTDTCE